MANQFLSLALFIVLLSFFIVLTSFSSYETTKTNSVMSSLTSAFSSYRQQKQIHAASPVLIENATSHHEGQSLDQLEGLFTTQITGIKVEKNTEGNAMRLRVPLEEFERNILANDQVGGTFLPTLVSLVQSASQGVPYRMDMVMNLKKTPASIQNNKALQARNNIRKMGTLAQVLQDAGLPKNLISAGLGRGKAGHIDLYFYQYQSFDPSGYISAGG